MTTPVAWRTSVPFRHMNGSLSGEPQDNVFRFQPDVGKPILSKRYTAVNELYSFVVPMSHQEFSEFRDMYKTDFEDGSLSFYVLRPTDGVKKVFTFNQPYTWSEVHSGTYHVGMVLIEEPEE